MSFLQEFKTFAMKGNVVDMAVGIIIGGAFGKIVSSLVSDIIMPPIGILVGGMKFDALKIVLQNGGHDAAGKAIEPITLNYGSFIQSSLDFVIIAFSVFLMIKAMNSLKKKSVPPPPAPAAPSPEQNLLTEIRDILKEQKK